jgi:hypothetical protein
LLCSASLFAIGSTRSERRRGSSLQWYILALTCALLSLDEIAGFHEMMGGRSGSPGTALLQELGLVGNAYFYFDWVLAAGALVVLLALLYLPLFARLPRTTMLLLGLGALSYVAGALGAESLSSEEAYTIGDASLRYHVIAGAEELLESTGVLLALTAFLFYLRYLRAAAPLRALTEDAPARPVTANLHRHRRVTDLRHRFAPRAMQAGRKPVAPGGGTAPRV